MRAKNIEISCFTSWKLAGALSWLVFSCACSSGDSPGKEEVSKAVASSTAEAAPRPPEDQKQMAQRVMMGQAGPEPQETHPLDPKYIEALKPTSEMAAALGKYSLDFVTWKIEDYPPERIKNYPYSDKSLPYAVKGDFNGDGIEDMAVAGHDKDSNLVLGVLSSDGNYRVLVIRYWDYYAKARKYGKDLPYTATDIIARKDKGYEFGYGDMAVHIVKMKNDGFSWKGIAYFDSDTHTLKESCGEVNPYEYTDQFLYHGEILRSSAPAAIKPAPVMPKVELAPPRAKALREYNEKFVLWELADYPAERIKDYPYSENSLPYAVKGDLNGDGLEDIVLSGHDEDSNIVVAMISGRAGYHALPVLDVPAYSSARKHKNKLPFTPTWTLTVQEKGRKCVAGYDKRETVLKTDGVLVKYIDSWAPVPGTDEYNPEYELTGKPGGEYLYEYAEKFFSYPGTEESCVFKDRYF